MFHMKQKVVLEFINYSPRIYSGFDKYNLVLASKLVERGYLPVFVFSDSMDQVPAIADDLRAVGAKIELIPSGGKWNTTIAVFKLYIKHRPIVVHTHFVEFIKVLTAVFSALFGAKHYSSFHSTISLLSASEYQQKKGIFKRFSLFVFYRILLMCSTQILTVSEAIKQQFLDFAGTCSQKVKRLYLGVELKPVTQTKEEIRAGLKLPIDQLLLCNISAFEPIKGIDICCKAISILKYDYYITNFMFCHLGGLRTEEQSNIDYRNSIYHLAVELKIEDSICWLGHRNDITSIIGAFDIYVHPSRMEGLPVAIMEATTQSLPIIGTNVGGIPEIVMDGVNGYLFDSENATQLAEKMYLLINDIELRQATGKESLRIVSEHFEIKKQVERLIACYQVK